MVSVETESEKTKVFVATARCHATSDIVEYSKLKQQPYIGCPSLVTTHTQSQLAQAHCQSSLPKEFCHSVAQSFTISIRQKFLRAQGGA
eukprot:1060684-Amphidinium_carterae.1